MISKADIEPVLRRWQTILRLADWDISIRMVDRPWRKSGDIKIDQCARTAVLMINSTPVCKNLEQLVVHELLHLKLYGLDQMLGSLLNAVFGSDNDDPRRQFAYDQFFLMLEPTVEDLTKSLLTADGNAAPICSGRVDQQVNDELDRANFS